jgi:hypothetical protein
MSPGNVGRVSSDLNLHLFDHPALLGNIVFDDADPIGLALPLAGSDEIVEDNAVDCLDDIPADAGFARQCRNR